MSIARGIGGEDLGQETSMIKVGVAPFIGALVEWCDYFLYGLAASVVFTKLFFPSENPLVGTLAAFATFGVGFFFRPVGGAISDRIGRRPVYMWGAGFLVLFAFPFFWLANTESPTLIRLAIVLAFAVGNGAMFATQPAFFSELFGTRVRYSGVSFGYQLAAVFAGALAPFIATALLAWAGSYWPVAFYVMVAALISFVSVYLATESFREDLTEELAREPQGARA